MENEYQATKNRVTTISMLLIITGAILAGRTAKFVASAEHATGTVLSISNNSASSGKGYPAVIEFQAKNGGAHQFEIFQQRKRKLSWLQKGENVEVLYNPARPASSAKINKASSVWLWPGICFLSGILFFIFRDALAANNKQGAQNK